MANPCFIHCCRSSSTSPTLQHSASRAASTSPNSQFQSFQPSTTCVVAFRLACWVKPTLLAYLLVERLPALACTAHLHFRSELMHSSDVSIYQVLLLHFHQLIFVSAMSLCVGFDVSKCQSHTCTAFECTMHHDMLMYASCASRM